LSSFATNTDLASKVDKVVGKGLSTDYSSAEKAKLGAISGTNTGDQDLSSFATNTDLASKVDKVVGRLVHRRLFGGRESQTRFNLRYHTQEIRIECYNILVKSR
jgi:hypothetical protein